MACVRSVDGTVETVLDTGWQCAPLPAGRCVEPSGLGAAGAQWVDAQVPGTAAGALDALSAWTFDAPRDFDAEDWWFRCRFPMPDPEPSARSVLRVGGLATLADIWLDGRHLLHSENMFLEHAVDIDPAPDGQHRELFIRCASVTEDLKKQRPRPRWRAGIVAHQQLRWLRTTLLGRMPAWAPPVAPVGPYRAVSWERRSLLASADADVRTSVAAGTGLVHVTLRLRPVERVRVEAVSFLVGSERVDLSCRLEPGGVVVAWGRLSLRGVSLWWPCTHGDPTLYDVTASVRTDRGVAAIDLGRTGFRSLDLDRSGGGFTLRLNGVEVFCRGAVWTPLDVVRVSSPSADLRGALQAARDAGMNMLRVSGAMVYESQRFHDLCDELGILVWQDFMFANMDYPADDPDFACSVRREAAQLLGRLQLSPSLAVLCGNSEAAQQAAMLGLPPDEWSNRLFAEVIPAVAASVRPDVAYCSTTPDGGTLPFRADAGVSHYYGVGAYCRPVQDARRARVRFTSECLAFANIPGDETIEHLMAGGGMPTHHPRWKARVPRDKGTGWDFDDVRDHYVRRLCGIDPVELRMRDPQRYLELGRVATGETMLATVAEWRRDGSECRGALVWFLRDLWAGAGWGVVDAFGRPKAAYYYLKRAFAPRALMVTDEGLNGLALHAINDGPHAIDAAVHLAVYRSGEILVAEGRAPVRLPAHGGGRIDADALLNRFVDITYAYRFGPPGHDLVVANLLDATGERIADAFFFPLGYPTARSGDLGLSACAERCEPGVWRVTVRTTKYAQAVAFDARGFVADDDYFHIEPGGERVVILRGAPDRLTARVCPLNAVSPTPVIVRSERVGAPV